MRRMIFVLLMSVFAAELSAQILLPIVGGKAVVITGTPPAFSTACQAHVVSGGGVTTAACTLTTPANGVVAIAGFINSITITLTSVTSTCGGTMSVDDNVPGAGGGTYASINAHAFNVT